MLNLAVMLVASNSESRVGVVVLVLVVQWLEVGCVVECATWVRSCRNSSSSICSWIQSVVLLHAWSHASSILDPSKRRAESDGERSACARGRKGNEVSLQLDHWYVLVSSSTAVLVQAHSTGLFGQAMRLTLTPGGQFLVGQIRPPKMIWTPLGPPEDDPARAKSIFEL